MAITEENYYLREQAIRIGVHYAYPELNWESDEYKALVKFIREEFEKIQVVILWYLDEEFMKLARKLKLPNIEKKEVVFTRNYVKATMDCREYPKTIYQAPVRNSLRFN